MEKAVSLLKQRAARHWAALVLAVAVGVVYGLHHIVLVREVLDAGVAYHPLVVNEDEAMFTGPKAHAAEMGEIVDMFQRPHRDDDIKYFPHILDILFSKKRFLCQYVSRATAMA